jgi:hypothetical protein
MRDTGSLSSSAGQGIDSDVSRFPATKLGGRNRMDEVELKMLGVCLAAAILLDATIAVRRLVRCRHR